jgi:hypothetical protein
VNLNDALDALRTAVDEERDALIAFDGERIRSTGETKLAALDSVGEALRHGGHSSDTEARLRDLYDRHQANANLLLRRRQETSWLLQALGAVAPESAYNARGGRGDSPLNRHLAEA